MLLYSVPLVRNETANVNFFGVGNPGLTSYAFPKMIDSVTGYHH
jgi:hypothetical protein